jgi:hypothetical protein
MAILHRRAGHRCDDADEGLAFSASSKGFRHVRHALLTHPHAD